MSPYNPGKTELGNYIGAGKLAWFQAGLEEETLQATRYFPVATLESLYPEIALFGPAGFAVQRLKEDWIEKGYLNAHALTVDDSLAALGFLLQTMTIAQFDNEPGELVSNLGFLSIQLGDNVSSREFDILTTMFRWLVVDGFLKSMEKLPAAFTWALEDYRDAFRELAEAVGLKGNDYLG